MRYLLKRNLLIFFRDKSSVFFSLLSVFIIIGLYVLFLGDMIVQGMSDMPGARFLMDSWIMSGLLAVTPITTSLGAMGTIIVDKKYGLYKDFAVSPLKRSTITGGYVVSAFFISLILTLLTFVLAEVYIVLYGGELLAVKAVLKVMGLILFTTASSSIMMFYLVSWFNSVNAFSAASTIIGTLIGFLTGIYIPIGNLPSAVQTAIKIFPPSHAAVLFRKIMMEQAEKVTFAGAPAEALEGFRLELGIAFKVGDTTLSSSASFIYVLFFMVLMSVLSLYKFSKKEK
ncbi:MAG: ABC transporter permease [Caldicoprobacterales bacterium]|jgi:multidrug/hemolysin transport system permease protein|nr:ABC transporter permease [Clostridiales bacterium]